MTPKHRTRRRSASLAAVFAALALASSPTVAQAANGSPAGVPSASEPQGIIAILIGLVQSGSQFSPNFTTVE